MNLAGLPDKNKLGWVGAYSDEYSEKDMNGLKTNINNYEPQEWPCPSNLLTGTINCTTDCLSSNIPEFGVKCLERRKFTSERRLCQLMSRSLLHLLFEDPKLVVGNDLLKDEELIYSHQ